MRACHPRGSQVFRCACGEKHRWSVLPDDPAFSRIACGCGLRHVRVAGVDFDAALVPARAGGLGGCAGSEAVPLASREAAPDAELLSVFAVGWRRGEVLLHPPKIEPGHAIGFDPEGARCLAARLLIAAEIAASGSGGPWPEVASATWQRAVPIVRHEAHRMADERFGSEGRLEAVYDLLLQKVKGTA